MLAKEERLSMVSADALQQARATFERQSWREAYEMLSNADREQPLAPDDLYRLAECAHMLGQESETVDIWRTRASRVPRAR